MIEVKVLLVGGPMDGQWVNIPANQYEVIVPDPDSWKVIPSFKETDIPAMTPLKRLRYECHPPIQFFNWKLRVAVLDTVMRASYPFEKEILKTILQRDVANELGLFR